MDRGAWDISTWCATGCGALILLASLGAGHPSCQVSLASQPTTSAAALAILDARVMSLELKYQLLEGRITHLEAERKVRP